MSKSSLIWCLMSKWLEFEFLVSMTMYTIFVRLLKSISKLVGFVVDIDGRN